VNKVSGLDAEFVRINLNSALGGNVSMTGDGIVTTASNNSQTYIQNGIVGSRISSGATVGQIGVNLLWQRPYYTITTSLGSNFMIQSRIQNPDPNSTDGYWLRPLRIYPSSNEMYIGVETLYTAGITAATDIRIQNANDLVMTSGNIVNPYGIYLNNGGRLYTISDSITRLDAYILQFRVGTDQKFRIDSTRNYSNQPLNMQGHQILESPSVSDSRFKYDIQSAEQTSLERLKKIEYVNFRWKENDRYDIGFIAQQVQNITPEIMMDVAGGYLGYNGESYMNLIGHSVQQLAIMEENTNKVASKALLATETNAQKIKRLENEIKELKGAA
jgi:hypothetical protein